MTYQIVASPSCGSCDPPSFYCGQEPPPVQTCANPFILLARKLKLSACTAGLSIPLSPSACEADAEIMIYVRRRGTSEWLVKYPPVSVAYSSATFLFDHHLFSLPCGRYEADVRSDGISCVVFELNKTPECAVALKGATLLSYAKQLPQLSKPPGASDMFDAITTLNVETCRPLKIGEGVLPLNMTDTAALCAIVLCKPVNIIIDDGVRRETLQFTGCINGVPQVTRGAAGTTQQDFPKGSRVYFTWDTYNTTTALEGC